MATIIDVFENFLGEELTPHLPRLANRLSRRQLLDLTDLVFFFLRNQEPAPNHAETLIAMMPREVGVNEIRETGAAKYVASISHQLLYYPRVHLFHQINPFFYALMKEPWHALDEFVKVYVALRDLIQSRAVVIAAWPDTDRTEPYIRELNGFAANDPELQAYVKSLATQKAWPKKLGIDAVIDEYNITQVVASETNTAWTAPYRALLDIHEFEMSRTNQAITSTGRVNIRAAELFADLKLPALEKLEVGDLVRIRNEEDAFVEWRNEMAGIARSVLREESLTGGSLGREFSQQAHQRLTSRVSAIREKMKSKSLRQYSRDAVLGFSAGVTTAVTLDPPLSSDGIATAIAKPLVAGAAGLLFSLLTKRATAKDRLLYRFYSLFEDPRPA